MKPETQAVIDAALKRLAMPYEGIGELPHWLTEYRPFQIEAIDRIVEAYRDGTRMVVLDAPTGSGKTLIGETVRRLVGGSGLYVCNNKTLQDQFAADFPDAKVVKGRSNYPTWETELQVTADDCNFTRTRPCSWCPEKASCPYEVAKLDAVTSRLAVLNTAYFMAETNGPGAFKNRDLVVLDEADTLETSVMGFAGLQVSRRRVEELGLGEPGKVTKEEAWLDWIDESIPIVDGAIPLLHDDERDVDVVRNWNYLMRLAGSLRSLRKQMLEGGWVYTGKDGAVSFKPVRVHELSPALLWGNGKRFLLMSATTISAEAELDWHGWNEPYEVVQMGSTFAPDTRRVKIVSCADMSRKANEREELADGLRRVLARHPNERVLVHTVSYDLTSYVRDVVKKSGRRCFTYNQTAGRVRALEQFRRTRGSVLVAPSMDRGVDLPDDLCRVVVIAKVPFPYLGDRQVSARLHAPGGQQWYNIQTVRSIVQMTGRATRHKDDWSVSYVLDRQFERVWSNGRRLFPSWWTDALDWRDKL